MVGHNDRNWIQGVESGINNQIEVIVLMLIVDLVPAEFLCENAN